MAKQSKSKSVELANPDWEWVDESKEVIESVNAPRGGSASFNFVLENGVSRPRGEKPRKLIRAHATRHGRAHNYLNSKTKKENKNEPQNPSPSPKPSLMHRFPRSTTLDPFKTLPGGETSETSILLDYYTQSKEFEPFKPLPGSPTPETNAVLNEWIAVQSDSSLAVGGTDIWLSFAKSEPALFHVTLLHAGIRLSGHAPTPAVQIALLHQRGEAIRSVSQYLSSYNSRTRSQSPSESDSQTQTKIKEEMKWTIVCSVAALAHADSALAMNESCLGHLNGLDLLVQEMGGLEVFERFWGGRARSYIEWTDMNASLLVGRPPRFARTRGKSGLLGEKRTTKDMTDRSAG